MKRVRIVKIDKRGYVTSDSGIVTIEDYLFLKIIEDKNFYMMTYDVERKYYFIKKFSYGKEI